MSRFFTPALERSRTAAIERQRKANAAKRQRAEDLIAEYRAARNYRAALAIGIREARRSYERGGPPEATVMLYGHERMAITCKEDLVAAMVKRETNRLRDELAVLLADKNIGCRFRISVRIGLTGPRRLIGTSMPTTARITFTNLPRKDLA